MPMRCLSPFYRENVFISNDLNWQIKGIIIWCSVLNENTVYLLIFVMLFKKQEPWSSLEKTCNITNTVRISKISVEESFLMMRTK